ncbi:MAG: hypothetical protein M3O22_02815 [Pseudomonadota bacterium]|nr:hypothetical protein [Pseudomonadota bacterium]
MQIVLLIMVKILMFVLIRNLRRDRAPGKPMFTWGTRKPDMEMSSCRRCGAFVVPEKQQACGVDQCPWSPAVQGRIR